MTRKFKYFATSLFIMGWLFLFGPSIANADEVTIQVTPADPNTNSDTSTVTSTVTIESVQAKIETASSTLTTAAQEQSSTIVATIQANVPNTDTQTAVSIATTQEPIKTAVDSATAKVQEANSAIQSANTAVQAATTAQSSVDSQTAVVSVATSIVDSATATVNIATSAVESQTAVVNTANSDLQNAQNTLTQASTAVDSQTVVVQAAQSNKDSAQAVVDSNTTPGLAVTIYSNPGTAASPAMGGTVVYTGTDTNGINEQWGGGGPTVNSGSTTITETFNNNQLNTTIGITVNGTPVSTTNNNNVYISSIGWPSSAGMGSDPSLTLRTPTAVTTITMPTGTTSAGFSVFAKNGNTTGTITYTDGTTESYVIQDDVNPNYPNYVHQETFVAPSGKTIATVTIPTDWDYFAIDNVSATKPNTAVVTEDFQVRWQGLWTPQTTGTQYITAPADDGVKLYLDGQLVINDWVDKGGGGSTADVATTAGVSKTFDMWYYENGGGANVALKRYTGSGWEVIPASEFSQSTATPTQIQNLNAAVTTLTAETATLSSLQAVKTTAQTEVTTKTQIVESSTATLNTLQQNLTVEQQNLTSAQQNLTTEQQNLTTAQQNLTIAIQTADSLANSAVTKVNEAVTAMTNAAQVTINYYAEQQRIAAENARIAAEQAAAQARAEALAAQQAAAAAEAAAAKAAADKAAAEAAAAKAEAEAKAAAEAQAKAEAEAKAAAEAAAKAEADKLAAEQAAAKAEAEAKAQAEAQAKAEAEAKAAAEAAAKAEADKAAAEAKAKEQAAKDAKAEADKAAAEQKAAEQAAKDAQAKEDAIKKAAEEKKLEEAAGVKPNSPNQLSDTVVKEAPKEALVARVQVDKAGVENGGIEFFGTKSAPQVVGEDGKLTPPAPPPGSGLPIPPDAITTTDTFIGQPGGTTFNAPDIAVPVIPKVVCVTVQDETGKEIHVDSNGDEHEVDMCIFLPAALDAIPGAGEAIQAVGAAYAAMANLGNDMSPVTRKKAKKVLLATIVLGQIAAFRRRFGE